jgi:hypothetical protein
MNQCTICGSAQIYERDAKPSSEILALGLLSVPEVTVRVCGECGHITWHCKPHTLQEVRETFKLRSWKDE